VRGIAYYTTIAACDAASRAILRLQKGALDVMSLQEHLAHNHPVARASAPAGGAS
jgi:hypothetical protein